MSLLVIDPIAQWGTNVAAMRAQYPNNNGSVMNQLLLVGNFNIVGRVSGTYFGVAGVGGTAAAFPFLGNTHPETIIYIAAHFGTTDSNLFSFGTLDSGSNLQWCVQFSSLGLPTLRSSFGGTILRTASASVNPNIWNFYEIRSVIHNISGSVAVKVNGVQLMSESNVNTRNAGSTNFAQFFGFGGNPTYYQDVLIMNTTGSDWNAPIANSNFVMVSYLPSGSATYSDFTPSGSATPFRNVNEVTPDDDTSYNSATPTTLPARHTFTWRPLVTGSGAVNIPTTASIAGLAKVTRGKITSIQTTSVEHLVRISGTDYTGSVPISSSANYKNFTTAWQLNPATGLPWTQAEITAIEAGIIRLV